MKKILSIFLIALVLIFSNSAYAISAYGIETGINASIEKFFVNYNQKCGENLTWVLQNGTLTISGFGDMYNYDAENAPWYEEASNINEVILSDSVSFIGNYAFYNCVNLSRINISDSVTQIGYDAFKNCSSLKSIEIPNSVSVIGSSAFENCVNLESIKLPDNLIRLHSFVFANCKSLKEIIINYGTEQIDAGAFTNCSSLESVYIPKSVKSIGERAFYGCNKLKKIIYEDNEGDWNNINISGGNSPLLNCRIEYLPDDGLEYYECPHCGKLSAEDKVIYDRNGDIYCPHCKENLALNEDLPFSEYDIIECPFCIKDFDVTDEVIDENGNVNCPYCGKNPEEALLENDEEEKVEPEFETAIEDDNTEVIVEETYNIACLYCELILEVTETYGDEIICPYCGQTQNAESEETEYLEEESYIDNSFIASNWAMEEVKKAYSNNLIPEEMLEAVLCDNITREEFAAISIKLYEAMGGYAEYTDIKNTPFLDCKTESPYVDYIGAAYTLGITNGKTINMFAPDDLITREQMAVMFYRVIKLDEQEGLFSSERDFDINNVRKFSDDAEISDYAREGVYYMAENGVIKGIDGANFAPQNTATREQALIMSNRIARQLG